jgi:hypothetical protein
VTDVFHEVDEEVRREQLQKLWDRYQNYVIAAVALMVLGVAGWRGYDYLETKKAQEAGSAFEEAVTLSEDGKHAESEQAFATIATTGTSGYRSLARVREAAELAQRDPKAAVVAYEKISSDSTVDPVLRDLAGLRAGAILIDSAPFSEAQAKLEPLAGAGRIFRHTARELLALGAWRAGDTAGTRRWSDLIMADSETPGAVRNRTEMLMTLTAPESKG